MWFVPRSHALLLMAAAAAGGCAVPAQAGPRNGAVVGGSATITTPAPGRTEINQSSDRLIVNWQGFSIGADEIARFNQPSSNAVALNRVTGGEPSQILGQLSANGKILLINPNGILFGAGSRIDVAGLVATTANLANDDFMARRLNFTMPSDQPTASVVNRGTITVKEGGLVALVAPAVANQGVINARLGKVSLVAADRFTVDFHGDRLVQFALDDKVTRTVTAPDGAALGAAVTNSGRIAADGGTVQMTANVARGVLDRVIDMSGVVEARAARKVGGTVILDGGDAGTVQVSGNIDASGRGTGQIGGTVRILGERVGLFAGARVDASGDAGGGIALVGGNQQGQGPERRAQATYVDKDAAIRADALTRGDGGKVVVWSDGYTRFDGAISARAGTTGGDGGFVETSSHGILDTTGRVDAGAPAGKGGTWLLDPTDITITGGTNNGSFGGGNPNTFTPTAGQASGTADVVTINAALSAGTSVTINTASSGAGAGNITVSSAISKTGGGTALLTLNASNDYIGNGTITSTSGALNFSVNTGGGYVGNQAVTLNGGNLTVNTGGSYAMNAAISTGAGSVNVTSGGAYAGNNSITTANANVTISAGGGYAGSGTITTANGALSITASGGGADLGGASTGNGTITVSAAGAITQNAPLLQSIGTTTSSFTAGANAITLTNGGNTLSAVSLSNSGNNNVAVVNNGALQLMDVHVGSGTLSLTSNNSSVTQTGATTITQAASGGAVTISAVTFIDISKAGNQFTGSVGLTNATAGATVQLNNSRALDLGASSIAATNTVTITAAGAITQSGAFQTGAGTTTTVDGGANPISLTNSGNTFRTLSVNNSGNNAVSVTNSVPLTMANSTVGGALTFTVDQLTTPGGVTVTSTNGGALTVQPLTASRTVRFGGASVAAGLNFTDAQRGRYGGFTSYVAGSATGTGSVLLDASEALGNASLTLRSGGTVGSVDMQGNTLTLTGSGAATLSAGGSVTAGQITTASGAITITAGGTATLGTVGTTIATAGGAITVTGAIALPGATTLNTTLSGSTGGAISLNGAISGTQNLFLNAGSAGDITLQSTSGSLGQLLVTNARNVTATGAVSAASFLQSAGTGTTNFQGGLTTTGSATLTTASVAGTYTVGSFTVTSGQTIATGTIAGVGGTAAAALAIASSSSGTQTFNGCTIGSTSCGGSSATTTTSSSTTSTTSSGSTMTSGADLTSAEISATRASRQVLGVIGQGAPGEDSDRSNVHGFEVTIPTQNVDWSDPGAELRVQLAPEYQGLSEFFPSGESLGRATRGGRGGR